MSAPTLWLLALLLVLGAGHAWSAPAPRWGRPPSGRVLRGQAVGGPVTVNLAPAIQVLNPVNCGAVLASSAPNQVLVLDPTSSSSALRSASRGVQLAEDAPVALGAFTLTGPAGADWTLSVAGGSRIALMGPAGPPPSIAAPSLTLGPSNSWSGSFPSGPTATTTTPPLLLGLSVQIPPFVRNGVYTGIVPLLVRDGFGAVGFAALAVNLQVDLAPMGLFKVADLDFGTVLTGGGPGRVELDPSGHLTATGGAILGPPGAAHPARFTATGSPNMHFGVTLPAAVTLAGPGGRTLRVTGFSTSPGDNRLDPDGQRPFRVGATLELGASPGLGRFTGTFQVTVNYD